LKAADPGVTCPSSTCTPGNLLLGIVRPNGHVAALRNPIPIDKAFVDKASEVRRAAEMRFRFAGPCVTTACQHWTGARCEVSDAVTRTVTATSEQPFEPTPCAIRSSCRWWSQNGAAACRACSFVVHSRDISD
jgi:hypothetical protein